MTKPVALALIFFIGAFAGCTEEAGKASTNDTVTKDGFTITGGEPFYFWWDTSDPWEEQTPPERWFAMNFTVTYEGTEPRQVYDTFGDIILVDSDGRQTSSWSSLRWEGETTQSAKFAPGTSATITVYWNLDTVAEGEAKTWWGDQSMTHHFTSIPQSTWTYP